MGAVLDKVLLPGQRSYSIDDSPTPPLIHVAGVPCLQIVPRAVPTNKVVLYMHGNAEDLGLLWRIMLPLAEKLGAVIYCMEYRGYGIHHGSTDPKGTIVDGARVLRALTRKHHEPINLLGYSVGTAVASAVAAHSPDHVASLTLIAPFHSPHAIVKDRLNEDIANIVVDRTHPFDTATNLRMYGRSVLAIHGFQDDIVPIQQSYLLEAELGEDVYRLVVDQYGDHYFRLEDSVDDFLSNMV